MKSPKSRKSDEYAVKKYKRTSASRSTSAALARPSPLALSCCTADALDDDKLERRFFSVNKSLSVKPLTQLIVPLLRSPRSSLTSTISSAAEK